MKKVLTGILSLVLLVSLLTLPAGAAKEPYSYETYTVTTHSGDKYVRYTFEAAATGYAFQAANWMGQATADDGTVVDLIYTGDMEWEWRMVVLKDQSTITVEFSEGMSFWDVPEGYSNEFLQSYQCQASDFAAWDLIGGGTEFPDLVLKTDYHRPLVTSGPVEQLFSSDPGVHSVVDLSLDGGGAIYFVLESQAEHFLSAPESGLQLKISGQSTMLDTGLAYESTLTNPSDQPIQGYYALLTYWPQKMENTDGSEAFMAQVQPIDVDLPAKGSAKIHVMSSHLGLANANLVWISFEDQAERDAFLADEALNGINISYYMVENEQWLKDNFGITLLPVK